jgi:alpha-tubulin suppressor-like RCC1 family protein
VSSYFQRFCLMPEGVVEAVGGDQLGELGIGFRSQDPVVQWVQVVGLSGVVQVARGSYALLANGTTEVWGKNDWGQLGNGTHGATGGALTPVPVSGVAHIVAIAGGGGDRLALAADGRVLGWGESHFGQLGLRAPIVDRPRLIATGVVEVAVGGQTTSGTHVLLRHADGTISCLGDDRVGECSEPHLRRVVEIAAGFHHSIFRRADGSVWEDGIGIGPVPRRIALPGRATQVSAGSFYSEALVSGVPFGWGRNHDGDLGDGTRVDKPRPVAALGLSGIRGVSAGEYHTEVWR